MRHDDAPRLGGMLELPVGSPGGDMLPAVLLEQPDETAAVAFHNLILL